MGITGLLPFLDNSTRHCNISEFRGLRVGVDSYCWLHKGARGCADVLAKGLPTDMYVKYCMKLVQTLLSYNIKPVMVFDGKHLVAKAKTEEKRRKDKKLAKKLGIEHLRLGNNDIAYTFFKKCVDVTHTMALALINECRKAGVDCLVAPYESDAQLAYLSINNFIDLVISEDSDLVLFGAKKVLYKFDLTGNGQLVETAKINLSMQMREKDYSFDKFRAMCVLSGCDYLDSLPGIGLKKALKFLKMTAETNPEIYLDKLPRYLNKRELIVTPEYKESFLKALATFQHQTVYDPCKKHLVPLKPLEDSTLVKYCTNVGAFFNEKLALEMALGNVDPITLKEVGNYNPFITKISRSSIWSPELAGLHPKSETYVKPSCTVEAAQKIPPKEVSDNTEDGKYDDNLKKELLMYKMRITPLVPRPEPDPEVLKSTAVRLTSLRQRNPFLLKENEPEPPKVVVQSRFFKQKSEAVLREEAMYPGFALSSSSDDTITSSTNSSSTITDESVGEILLCEVETIYKNPENTLSSIENIDEEPAPKKIRIFKSPKKQLTIKDIFKKMQEDN